MQAKIRHFFEENAILLVLCLIVLFFQIATGGKMLMPMNLSNVIAQNSYVVILAIGMLLCILTGGNIDLSVGSVVAFIGAVAGTLIITMKWNMVPAVAVCLAAGLLIGVWQGFWIAYIRIPAFIVTLAGMLIFRGLALSILGSMTLTPFPADFLFFSTGFLPDWFGKMQVFGLKLNGSAMVLCLLLILLLFALPLYQHFRLRKTTPAPLMSKLSLWKPLLFSAMALFLFGSLGQFMGIPMVLILLGILCAIYGFFVSNTVTGRHLYAIGGNEKAARLSGVRTNKLLFLTYVNMGFLAAVTGLVCAARFNSASPQAGTNFELDAIAACFIGGASAYGGSGTVKGAVIGALIMGVLNNGMSHMGIAASDQMAIKGLVLLLAVVFDVVSKKQTELPGFLSFLKK